MADDGHAVDAEQHCATVCGRIKSLGQRHELGQQYLGRFFGLGGSHQCFEHLAGKELHAAFQCLEYHIAGEAVGDHHINIAGHDVAPLHIADEVDICACRPRPQQFIGFFGQRVALAVLFADGQQPHPGYVDTEAAAGIHTAHLGELHQHGGRTFGVRAGVEQHRGRGSGHRNGGGDGWPGDAFDTAHPQQGAGHGGPGVAGGQEGAGPTVSNRFGSAHQRGVFLHTYRPGPVFVHVDDLGAFDELQLAQIMSVQISGASNQHHGNSQSGGLTSPIEDGSGGKIAAQNIDGHRECLSHDAFRTRNRAGTRAAHASWLSSMTCFIRWGLCDVDSLTALVPTTGRTHGVRQLDGGTAGTDAAR